MIETGSPLLGLEVVEVVETLSRVIAVPVITTTTEDERKKAAMEVVMQAYDEGVIVLTEDSYSSTSYNSSNHLEPDTVVPNYTFKKLFEENSDGTLRVDKNNTLIVDHDGYGLMGQTHSHTSHSLQKISEGEGGEYYTTKPHPFKIDEHVDSQPTYTTKNVLVQVDTFAMVQTNHGERKFNHPIPADDFTVLGNNSKKRTIIEFSYGDTKYRAFMDDFQFTTVRVYDPKEV